MTANDSFSPSGDDRRYTSSLWPLLLQHGRNSMKVSIEDRNEIIAS